MKDETPGTTSGADALSHHESIDAYPRRIVCLTEETTEVLYLLGQEHRIVGVSGYTVRPPEARTKPRVSAFTTAKFDKIMALEPDLVLAFSDLQAEIVRELIRRGLTVFAFNQRSVKDILEMILTLGRLVGCEAKVGELIGRLQKELAAIQRAAEKLPHRPRVFFEEWPDPLISGIRWVEELIDIAGGEPIFPELRQHRRAAERVVDPAEVVRRNPDLIIASWCGRRVNSDVIRQRPGWREIAAVKYNRIHEIKSTYILQPGPAALTEGVKRLHRFIAEAAHQMEVL